MAGRVENLDLSGNIPNLNRNGRKHHLSDPDYAHSFAEAVVAGMTKVELAEMFDKSQSTITKWKKDPRVTLIARKLIQDRVIEVTRRVDSVIAARLANAEELTIKELLDIRKEFMGDKLRADTEPVDSETVNEAQNFFDQNPDAAEQLRALLSGGQ